MVAVLTAGFAIGFVASRSGGEEPGRPAARAAAPVPAPPPPAPTPAPAPAAEPAPPPPAFAIAPLGRSERAQLRTRGFWHHGCPVSLDDLRLLTVTYRGFDGRPHTGALVVNASTADRLERVFRRLYRQRFPIRHIGFADFYGPRSAHPADGDVTGSFECRQAVPSPCNGGSTGSGHWSNHAYGLAVDLNPTENPYIGCGQSRDPATKPFRDRTRHRRGMIDSRVVGAFGSVGWGWGGAWTGSTKDYMHFSSTGH